LIQVVDASATIACLLEEGPRGDWCRKELTAGELIAPHLLPLETAGVIRRDESHKVIDPSVAATALRDLRDLDIELVPFEALADRVWDLRHNLTIYDACYVAAAELFECRLVTVDRRMASAPGIRCKVTVAPAS